MRRIHSGVSSTDVEQDYCRSIIEQGSLRPLQGLLDDERSSPRCRWELTNCLNLLEAAEEKLAQ